MKWLIIQSAGAHDGSDDFIRNDYLRECLSLQWALEQHGEEAEVWGKRHPSFRNPPDFEQFNCIICVENYHTDWLPDFSSIRRPVKLQWIIDLHCGGRTHCEPLTQHMDVVLHSTRSLMPDYRSRHPQQRHIWFPNAADDRYFRPDPHVQKTRDLLFVGHPRNRKDWIRYCRKLGAEHLFTTGQGMINAIRSARIHLNKSISCDVNYRCFETIGLGTCLCTNRIDEMHDLGFRDGVNCLLYSSNGELKDKTAKALQVGSWRQIGAAGAKLFARHTYAARLRNFLQQHRQMLQSLK